MANFGKNKKAKESAAQAKDQRQQELSTNHAEAVAKKFANMIPLMDMRKEASGAPCYVWLYLHLLLGLEGGSQFA